MPHWNYENDLWKLGTKYVGGIDEVGRGCFAGPVFAACVGFDSGVAIPAHIPIEDSKKITHNRRIKSYRWIKNTSLFMAVGSASVGEINKIGIVSALHKAMVRAVNNAEKNAGISMDHLLIDAVTIPNLQSKKQTAIIKGDAISYSIAAASIVAKVTRDDHMQRLSERENLQHYGWYTNKGYGTRKHCNAIIKHGITKHHRKQFVESFLRNQRNN